jgi:histidinol-phosphate phosphatase family protein
LIGRPAVFADRDGTLMVDVGYVRRPEDVELIPGVAGAVRRLNDAGMPIVVVTNQSGIARGLLTEADYEAVQRRFVELLAREGAQLSATYMCPHHPEVDGPCDCRKPGARLYRRAAAELSLDLARSFYVGDRWRDVAVTDDVGGRAILVKTGAMPDEGPVTARRVADFAAAVDVILTTGEET